MTASTTTFLSLFSGCGGFDLGFTNAGFQNVGAIDIDESVLQVHKANNDTPVFRADLSLGELPQPIPTKCDIMIAGSPCQGFSTIGKRRIDDPRNNLLLVTGKIAAKHKPKLVIAENVPGVISGKHRQYWEGLHQTLREAGYKTVDLRCDGTKMGVPQRRKRLFLIAWKLKKDITLKHSRG